MKTITTLGALAALALPGAALAQTAPTTQDQRNAAKECRALRGSTDATREAFRSQYRNFGACVSQKAKQERAQRTKARSDAAKTCKALRASNPEQFGKGPQAKYRNLGACVSEQAKQNKAQADQQDAEQAAATKNAARTCKALRTSDKAGFAARYGTKRNAFGKCVSATAKAQQDKQDKQDGPQDSTPQA